MADNPYKRGIVNQAMIILNAGKTSTSGVLFSSITDAQFADYTTVSESNEPDKRLFCCIYERVLKMVLEDIRPQFALAYADLGQPRKINQDFGGWDYLFELPSDFLCLAAQLAEGDPTRKCGYDRDPEVLHFKGYSHVVCGGDDQAYYCDTDHTSADDSSDGQPPDDDGDENWTLYNTDGSYGAAWAAGVAYENDSTGPMLATNTLTNTDGDSAYIQYVAYTQTTNLGVAGRSDQPQYYPAAFANAFATRLAAEMCIDSKDYERRLRLFAEYEELAKPALWRMEARHKSRTRRYTAFEARTR